MCGVGRGFLILNSSWWERIAISSEARNELFRLLYSCISKTQHSLYLYYSVRPCNIGSCDLGNVSGNYAEDLDNQKDNPTLILTYQHIHSLVKAYEIALDAMEFLNKAPTFDIRFVPLKTECLNHINRTIGPISKLCYDPNVFQLCDEHGPLVFFASEVNEIFFSICQKQFSFLLIDSNEYEKCNFVDNSAIKDIESDGFPVFIISQRTISFPSWGYSKDFSVILNDSEFMQRSVKRTLFAGTFDRLHPGHKVNITVATWFAEEMVIIGITDQSLLANKSDKDLLQDFALRAANVLSFIYSLSPDISVTILRICSVVGGADIFEFDALIATPESYNNALKINELRKNRGVPLVQLVEVPFVYTPQIKSNSEKDKPSGITKKFSSTEVRAYIKHFISDIKKGMIFTNTLWRWIFPKLYDIHLESIFRHILQFIESYLDDFLILLLHRWKGIYGDKKADKIFIEWLSSLISSIECYNSENTTFKDEEANDDDTFVDC
ncbi:hypothetical protein ACR3K2_23990 [Cryptosporidium serpentis]